MTVVYYTTVLFPDGGMASANRIRHLSGCLVANGCRVVVCAPFSDSGSPEHITVGGIEYRSFCHVGSLMLVRRIAYYLQYPLCVYRLLRTISDRKRCIHVYTSSLWQMFCAWLIARLTRCKITREGTEIPYALFGRAATSRFFWLWQFVEIRLIFHTYDGVVSITRNLFDYYSKICGTGTRHIHIPMTVDCDQYECERRTTPFPFDYIAYTGSMMRKGGGVDVLVKAFGELASKYEQLHLVLIGYGTDSVREMLVGLVSEDVRPRIHCLFSGTIPSAEMPRYIKNAKILAMLPLPTKQQEGCFPTKLGEYLASGVPCVVSNVGIPPQYLSDGENVRFVPADDPVATAATISDMLEHYDAARQVAASGKRYAREHFHYGNFGKDLSAWFRGLKT